MTGRIAASLLAVAALALAAPLAYAACKRITGKGVAGVKPGMTHEQLRAAKKVGKLIPGCELAGPKEKAAKLRKPLRGFVNYSQTSPRRVETIIITGRGAHARGVQVGDKQKWIRHSFRKAKFDHSTDETFLITLVSVPKKDGGPLQFAVSTQTKRVVSIGIPHIAFCE